jgi:hypothetical protein
VILAAIVVAAAMIAMFTICGPGKFQPTCNKLAPLLASAFLGGPFFSGLWLGLKEPGRHLKAYTLLGILLGALAGVLGGIVIVILIRPPAASIAWSLAFSATSVTVVTALMFVSGGWFGYLIKKFRSSRRIEPTASQKKITRRIAGPRKELDQRTLLLIQSLGPAALALIGTIITVVFSRRL